MNHKAKIKAFLENTKRLNKRFGITPLLYGSLGLEYVTGEDFSADDIDILIPEIYLRDKWETFRRYLETLGYELIDEHEHTFQKDGNSFSYARLEELRSFCGINASDIEAKSIDNISFMILSPEQYLAVYKKSSKDGYRKSVREKNDNEKILRIEAFLKAKEKEKASKKKFEIKYFCRMTLFATVAFSLLLLFVVAISILSFAWKAYDIGIIFLIILFVAFVALGFYFNYGLSVSPKYVTFIYYNEIRIFKYDDVTKIELWIDDDLVVGTVKAKREKEYNICFSDFNIGRSNSFLPKLWDVKVKISEKKAKKIEADSKTYDKIVIHNGFNKRSK